MAIEVIEGQIESATTTSFDNPKIIRAFKSSTFQKESNGSQRVKAPIITFCGDVHCEAVLVSFANNFCGVGNAPSDDAMRKLTKACSHISIDYDVCQPKSLYRHWTQH